MSELEPAIRQLFDATNRGDSAAFLDAFASDGVVDDWGRTFTGHTEIAGWNDRENIGVHSHIDVTGVTRDGDSIRVGVAVSGDGYNGGGAVHLRAGGRQDRPHGDHGLIAVRLTPR